MVERSVWNFLPPTSSVITLSPGPRRWIICDAVFVVVVVGATVEDACFCNVIELFVGFENSTIGCLERYDLAKKPVSTL